MKRPNLQVITGALVHRVLFDGTRAVGVEYSRNGATERVDVAGEVILAAGAIGSPHILQLSGVGDPEHLERVGIGVHHDLRGVGRNMQDHYLARVSCEIQGAPSLNQQSRGLGLAGQVLRYLADRRRHSDLCGVAGRRIGESAAGSRQRQTCSVCSPMAATRRACRDSSIPCQA